MFRAVCKLLFLLGLALFLPRFLLLYAPQYQILSGSFGISGDDMHLGMTSFLDYLKSEDLDISGDDLLLITNQIADHHKGEYLNFLYDNGIFPNKICKVGENSIFTKMDISSDSKKSKEKSVLVVDDFTKNDISKTDFVLVDLQNSGFVEDNVINCLLSIMQLCRQYKKQMIFLDRPNPLGALLEGPLVEVLSGNKKLMLPLRYGMSLGELSSYANQKIFNDKISLVVLPLKNYLRNSLVDFEKVQKVYTSGLFNMLNGICPADIKSDCSGKFQCFALPEYLNFPVNKWYELRAMLRRYNIDVSLCRYLHRRTNQHFMGIRLMIHDINKVSYLKVWQLILRCMSESNIRLRQTALLDDLFGHQKAKQFIAGNLDDETLSTINSDLKKFYFDAKSHFIYRPWPKKVLL